MPNALVPLANVTLSATATSVTFSSISSLYRDLVVIVNAKNTTGTTGLRMQFNSDTGATNYSWVLLEGTGSGVTAAATSMEALIGGPNSTSDSQQIYHILDYTATNKYKTAIVKADFPSGYTDTIVERWNNTAAINTVKLYPAANSFATGSTFALYGVTA